MPTFAVGAAPITRNADERLGHPGAAFPGNQGPVVHLIESLIGENFDLTTCQESACVDHAVTLPMALLWPGKDAWPVMVPVCINTVQFPLPSAARCYALGQAVGRAIQSWDSDKASSSSAPAACRTSSTANAPASSTRTSTPSSWRARPPT